jgi:hypothetical protein
MHRDDYHDPLCPLQRDAVIRIARRQQLARLALERRPMTKHAYVAALMSLWESLALVPFDLGNDDDPVAFTFTRLLSKRGERS